MKRKILLLALVAIFAAIAVGGTWAYITGVDHIHNVITTGQVDIDIDEKMDTGDGELVDFPEEGVSGVLPDTSVSKIVSVRNVGESTAWIRCRVEMKIWDADGNELPTEITVGDRVVPLMTIDVNDYIWIYEDGYYYYHLAVDPGYYTDILFEEVYFAHEMGNDYQDCTVNVIVYAEAVQTANNPIPDGGDVTDVQGWPES